MSGPGVPDRPLRVLHFAENFLPRLGGAEVAMHEMVQAQREQGVDARVLAPTMAERRRMSFPYPVVEFPKSRLYSNRLWAYGALSSLYLRWRFDVIHFQIALPHAPWALEWRRGLGLDRQVKVVVTPAGSDLNVLPEIGYGELVDPRNLPRARRVLAGADLLMPASTNMAARIRELAPESAGRIRVIPFGCSVDRLRHAPLRRAEARARFGIPEGSFVLVSVGRPARVKNYELLIEVVAAAARSIPEILLLSVGERDAGLMAMAERSGVRERLIFTGRFPPKDADPNLLLDLPHEGMIDAIAASDVGVLTSFVESYSLAAAEQGAAGLPLVLTRHHGVKDRIPAEFSRFILDEPDCGAFVDALNRLRSGRELYGAYSRGIAASMAGLSHAAVAARQIGAYYSMSARRGR